jgi:hypothetical protein
LSKKLPYQLDRPCLVGQNPHPGETGAGQPETILRFITRDKNALFILKEERIHGKDTERSAGVYARQDGLGGYGVS